MWRKDPSIAKRNTIAKKIRNVISAYNVTTFAVRDALAFKQCIAAGKEDEVISRAIKISEADRPSVLQVAVPTVKHASETFSPYINVMKQKRRDREIFAVEEKYTGPRNVLLYNINEEEFNVALKNNSTPYIKSDDDETKTYSLREQTLFNLMKQVSMNSSEPNQPVMMRLYKGEDEVHEYYMLGKNADSKWHLTNFDDHFDPKYNALYCLRMIDYPEKTDILDLSEYNDSDLIKLVNKSRAHMFAYVDPSTAQRNTPIDPETMKETWTLDKINLVSADVEKTRTAECQSFAAFLTAKTVANQDINDATRIQIVAHKDSKGLGTHNFVLINFNGNDLSYNALLDQKDSLLIGDLWLLALGHDTIKDESDQATLHSQGIYTLKRYPISHNMLTHLVEIFDSKKTLGIKNEAPLENKTEQSTFTTDLTSLTTSAFTLATKKDNDMYHISIDTASSQPEVLDGIRYSIARSDTHLASGLIEQADLRSLLNMSAKDFKQFRAKLLDCKSNSDLVDLLKPYEALFINFIVQQQKSNTSAAERKNTETISSNADTRFTK